MPLTKALCPNCLVLVVTQETDFIGKNCLQMNKGVMMVLKRSPVFVLGFFSIESDFYA